jgi:hypothetical protein
MLEILVLRKVILFINKLQNSKMPHLPISMIETNCRPLNLTEETRRRQEAPQQIRPRGQVVNRNNRIAQAANDNINRNYADANNIPPSPVNLVVQTNRLNQAIANETDNRELE